MPRRRGLATLLSLLFLFCLVMGPGPGVRLINPDPTDPGATFTILGGLPVIYAWAIAWYAAMAILIAVAYTALWRHERD